MWLDALSHVWVGKPPNVSLLDLGFSVLIKLHSVFVQLRESHVI